jgi:hypothetical protein
MPADASALLPMSCLNCMPLNEILNAAAYAHTIELA